MGKKLLPAASLALVCAVAMAPIATGKAPGASGWGNGVTVPGSPYRYTALSPRTDYAPVTVITQVARDGGRTTRWWHLPGRYQLPPMSYDGGASGLSADGKVLVLSRFAWIYPPRTTRLAILDTRVHPRHPRAPGEERSLAITRVRLRGSFSFQAISPHGSTVYLLQHLKPNVGAPIQVRALDSRTGELLPEPVVDSARPEERMSGVSIARATGPDGRWAYTLFATAGHERGKWGEPFIHALDTVGGRAVRVELPQLKGVRTHFSIGLRSEDRGRRLVVLDRPSWIEGTRPLLAVDMRTHRVSELGRSEPQGTAAAAWLAAALALVPVAGAVFWVARRRRKSGGDKEEPA